MIPYILSLLPDDLFLEGREPELFLAVNRALYDKYVADGAIIPQDIQFQKQLDICSQMPAAQAAEKCFRALAQRLRSHQAATRPAPLEPDCFRRPC